jgi:hypothetical protein
MKRNLVLSMVFGFVFFTVAWIMTTRQNINAESAPYRFICSNGLESAENFLNNKCNPDKNFMGYGSSVCCIAK